jgi:single-strand DNA-binding protein
MMINRIILEGRLGAEPERRETPTGKVVVRFPLPLFNPYKRENEFTEWIQCEVWNQSAEFINQYGKKGALVSVDGRLRNQRYEDKDGNTRYRVYISVDRLTLLEPRNRNNSSNTPSTNQQSNKQTNSSNSSNSANQSTNQPSNQNQHNAGGDDIDKLFEDFDKMIND